jgi:hypothetical protein
VVPSSEARPSAARAALCLFTLALGACAFRAGYDEVALTCELPTECTSGLCVDGICAPDFPDAGPDQPDAGTEDASDTPDAGDLPDADPSAPDAGIDPPAPVACGSMFLLRDDFDDGVRDSQWIPRADTGATVAESGGRLVIGLAAGSAPAEGSYRSKASYDLRSSSVAVTVSKVAGEITALEVRDFADRGAAIGVEGSALLAMTLDADAETTRVAVVYDPVAHRHWRLRESAGTLFWETSPDRDTWTAIHSEALPMTGTYGFAYLLAWGQRPIAGEAWFDDFNLPVTASPGFCKASSVKDTFDDGTLAPSFNNWVASGGCSGREANGRLELTFPGIGDSWCGAETSQLLDLRNDAVSVEVLVPFASGMQTFFEVVTLDRDKIEMVQLQGVLYMSIYRNGSQVTRASTVYDPTAARFWRLREASGTIVWEISPNGSTWTPRFSAPTAIDVSAVIIDMAGGHNPPGPGSTQVVRYDRLSSP